MFHGLSGGTGEGKLLLWAIRRINDLKNAGWIFQQE